MSRTPRTRSMKVLTSILRKRSRRYEQLGEAARFRVGQRVTAVHVEPGLTHAASDDVQALRRDEVKVAEQWWPAPEVRHGAA